MLDLIKIQRELLHNGSPWYITEGVSAFLLNCPKVFDKTRILEEKDETKFIQLTAMLVLKYIGHFTPIGWDEPIQKVAIVPWEICRKVAIICATRFWQENPQTTRDKLIDAIQAYAEEWKAGKTHIQSPAKTALIIALDNHEFAIIDKYKNG